MLKVDRVVMIRHKVLSEGRPIREVARDMGVSRNTVLKYVRREPDWKPKPVKRRGPKMEQVVQLIDALLGQWSKRTTKKQRIIGTRVHNHLVGKGHDVGITTARTYLRRKRRAEAEVTIPLVHRPGAEAQIDFFDVTLDVAGERPYVHAFVMSLPYSDWDCGRLCEQEDLPSFMDGHVRAFDRAGFVPRRQFLDCLRNSYAQTSVTPCSLRALEGAPVSTPLDWDEVHRTDLHSRSYAQTSSASA